MLSIVIPLYNEQDDVFPLHERVSTALHGTGIDYEVILVNDGSSDATEWLISRMSGVHLHD